MSGSGGQRFANDWTELNEQYKLNVVGFYMYVMSHILQKKINHAVLSSS